MTVSELEKEVNLANKIMPPSLALNMSLGKEVAAGISEKTARNIVARVVAMRQIYLEGVELFLADKKAPKGKATGMLRSFLKMDFLLRGKTSTQDILPLIDKQ